MVLAEEDHIFGSNDLEMDTSDKIKVMNTFFGYNGYNEEINDECWEIRESWYFDDAKLYGNWVTAEGKIKLSYLGAKGSVVTNLPMPKTGPSRLIVPHKGMVKKLQVSNDSTEWTDFLRIEPFDNSISTAPRKVRIYCYTDGKTYNFEREAEFGY